MTNIEEMYARDLTSRSLGILLDEVAPGRAVMHMPVATDMVNGHGIAHGGYLFLLADTAFAYACNAHGPLTVAQSAQITFLRPVQAGDLLSVRAVERIRHGRQGVYDVTVRRTARDAGDGGDARQAGDSGDSADVVAEFRGHSVTLTGNPRLSTVEDT